MLTIIGFYWFFEIFLLYLQRLYDKIAFFGI